MPSWLFRLVVGAAVATAGGLIAGAIWLGIWLASRGTVALVGQHATGKSTFLHVLRHGRVPGERLSPTTARQTERHVKIGKKQFTVLDNGGDRLRDWFRSFSTSGQVIYFFDASLVHNADAKALASIREDADHLTTMLEGSHRHRNMFVVGTHVDLIPEDQVEALRQHREIENLLAVVDLRPGDLVLGSMENSASARKLVFDLARVMFGSGGE